MTGLKWAINLIITLAAPTFYDATRSCTSSVVTLINIAREKWRNSRKNISPLKCYYPTSEVLRNVTAATAKKNNNSQISKKLKKSNQI